MEEGIVTKYSEDKGLGYIRVDDGEEILVERSSLDMLGYKYLNVGDHVVFDVVKTIRGPEAKHVKKS